MTRSFAFSNNPIHRRDQFMEELKKRFPDVDLAGHYENHVIDWIDALIKFKESTIRPEVNQCDGCRAGHSIVNGNHIVGGKVSMVCQASRYQTRYKETPPYVSSGWEKPSDNGYAGLSLPPPQVTNELNSASKRYSRAEVQVWRDDMAIACFELAKRGGAVDIALNAIAAMVDDKSKLPKGT